MTHSLIFMHDLVEWMGDAALITLLSAIIFAIAILAINIIVFTIRGK